jgi:RNA-directed DNA polymerase
LAILLGYKPSAISYILYKLPTAAKYTTFAIPKKGGGSRQIDAPAEKLKGLQRRLADVLYDCLREIEQPLKAGNKASHAFRRGQSIISNARPHTARRYVLNLDLQDFFPTFNFGRVRGFFLNNKQFKLAEPVATLVAQIACKDGKLPQGSPCSPVISELLAHFLDMRLIKHASKHKCTYTRYADDITFSTNQKQFPPALAAAVGEGWTLATELKSRIADAGFVINGAKTRMQLRANRQTVTGLTVNRKVNAPQRYYKLARAMTHAFLATGKYKRDGMDYSSVPRLEGILNHIYHIRERTIDIAVASEKDAEKRKELLADRTKQKNKYPSAIRKVYYHLVFFKHFIDPAEPLIICEGPTDAIYLKCAIRSLVAAHPKLASTTGGSFSSLNVRFFRYSDQAHDLLQLRGGSGDIKYFIASWKSQLKKFKYRPMKHPIIVLIDNDDGAKDIFPLLKGMFGAATSWSTDDDFYHLEGPLYLIKTPSKGATHKSCPESFFQPSVLATKIDGKTFNPEKDLDPLTQYGKVIFAERVVRPGAATINFSGFDPILSRIEAVIDHYSKLKAAAAATP